jgi:hypothetical protein
VAAVAAMKPLEARADQVAERAVITPAQAAPESADKALTVVRVTLVFVLAVVVAVKARSETRTVTDTVEMEATPHPSGLPQHPLASADSSLAVAEAADTTL